MITILAGRVSSALGDMPEQVEAMQAGRFTNEYRTIQLFDQPYTSPYYSIEESDSKEGQYDPVPYLITLIEGLFSDYSLRRSETERCGLFLGCAAGDASVIEPIGAGVRADSAPEYHEGRVGNGAYAEAISQHFHLNPFSLTYNTACTSSANALLDAATMLESGLIDYALVVGVEMAASQSLEGFAAMQLLSQEAIRPFDKNRDGLVLGEALSAVLLSRDDVAASCWYLRGGDNQCETHSVTGVNQDGTGIAAVIQSALHNSGVDATQITAVKAHGTASYISDLAEIRGMQRVFEQPPSYFSLKPYIGHTLGSCGTSELVLLMNAVEHGFLPASPNFSEPDEGLDWQPLTEQQACSEGVFLLNCFGFGGNNNAMVVERSKL